MLDRQKNKPKKVDLYEEYRRILKRPDLTNQEIEETRKNLSLPAPRLFVDRSGVINFIEMENQKQWWAPVYKGLIMDQKGGHYQRMKNAIWLFLYLLVNA